MLNILLYFREQEDFISLSFATISSTGPNAAIIHYKLVWQHVCEG